MRSLFPLLISLLAPPAFAQEPAGVDDIAIECLGSRAVEALTALETDPENESDILLNAAVSFQDCYTQMPDFRICAEGDFAECAFNDHHRFLNLVYLTGLLRGTFNDKQREAFLLATGVGKERRWTACVDDQASPFRPLDSSDVASALAAERIGESICDAIFSSLDASVVYGQLLLDRMRK